MNNDYLWDKTGEDAEIESLENLLGGLRFQPTAPPALPAAVAPRAFAGQLRLGRI